MRGVGPSIGGRWPRPEEVWVAGASADGAPCLVPLSFDWDGEALMATPTDSPTGRNLAATWAVRLGLGHTRDVSMIERRHRRSGRQRTVAATAPTKENRTYWEAG